MLGEEEEKSVWQKDRLVPSEVRKWSETVKSYASAHSSVECTSVSSRSSTSVLRAARHAATFSAATDADALVRGGCADSSASLSVSPSRPSSGSTRRRRSVTSVDANSAESTLRHARRKRTTAVSQCFILSHTFFVFFVCPFFFFLFPQRTASFHLNE